MSTAHPGELTLLLWGGGATPGAFLVFTGGWQSVMSPGTLRFHAMFWQVRTSLTSGAVRAEPFEAMLGEARMLKRRSVVPGLHIELRYSTG